MSEANSQAQTFDLDDRMTEETKQFVTNYLRIIKPSDTPKLDVRITRNARAQNATNTIANMKIDGLVVKKFNVLNKEDGHEISASLFTPSGVRDNSPITVFYHGGGWTFGTVDTHYHCVANLAESTKTLWLSVEYRLAPEHKMPTLLSDCRSVLEWVLQNKSTLGSENAKIGVSGDSAGGQLAAVITHEYRKQLDYQFLIYPSVDMSTIYDSAKEFTRDCYILVPEVMEFFIRNVINDESDLTRPEVSPIFQQDFKELPRCLIVAAELDPLIDNSRVYHQKLRENNVECEIKIVKGAIHAFFSNGFVVREAFGQALAHVVEFFSTI
jgi:acetyl esterase